MNKGWATWLGLSVLLAAATTPERTSHETS